MRVWIDHSECSGVGVRVDACPQVRIYVAA